ncbi:hypothetical protein ACTQ33_08415 [Candidatus Avoscillospira sp. LCP25S3_F1]|uniref:hypothetical protein n=1 Tax=Candidatus Avoscillospira sp. LCP25S3_F1 TaxID=3438825 RepID=UPI003F933A5F
MEHMEHGHRYDDILYRSRPVSVRHLPMSLRDRAAQFSPFAALSGHEEQINETARLTDGRVELSEEAQTELDRTQQWLLDHLFQQPTVSVTYFIPDSRKSGGAYQTVTGIVKGVDPCHRWLLLADGRRIAMDEVLLLKLCDAAEKAE